MNDNNRLFSLFCMFFIFKWATLKECTTGSTLFELLLGPALLVITYYFQLNYLLSVIRFGSIGNIKDCFKGIVNVTHGYEKFGHWRLSHSNAPESCFLIS